MENICNQIRAKNRSQPEDMTGVMSYIKLERVALYRGILSHLIMNPAPSDRYNPDVEKREKRKPSLANVFGP